jgi:hypothetical protein
VVRVRGWAVDNSDYGYSTIRIFVDGRPAGETVANRPRADVGRAYPTFGPNRGFDIQVPAANGKRLICAFARDRRNGREKFLGYREVTVAGPRGSLDRVVDLGGGKIRVEGWATDAARPGVRATVVVRIDDREVGRFATSVSRPDVVRAVPGAHPESGFSAVFAAQSGQRRVCVNVINSQGRSVEIRCSTVTVAPRPFGSLDEVSHQGGGQVRVRGWTIDPPRGTAPVPIRILVGGTVAASLNADVPRPDVGRAHPTYGPNHGFDHLLSLPAGTHRVCVETVHNNSTTELSCRDVVVTA